jgi:hypothetical protein
MTMASALDVFRAQREAAEEVQKRLQEATEALHALRQDLYALANDPTFRQLLNDERAWLVRAQDFISQVEHFREGELNRFWPAVWKRWAMIVVLILATGLATGAGYVWAARPYEAELASLRAGVELGDTVARRVLEMTPAERRQFEVLMKWREASR